MLNQQTALQFLVSDDIAVLAIHYRPLRTYEETTVIEPTLWFVQALLPQLTHLFIHERRESYQPREDIGECWHLMRACNGCKLNVLCLASMYFDMFRDMPDGGLRSDDISDHTLVYEAVDTLTTPKSIPGKGMTLQSFMQAAQTVSPAVNMDAVFASANPYI